MGLLESARNRLAWFLMGPRARASVYAAARRSRMTEDWSTRVYRDANGPLREDGQDLLGRSLQLFRDNPIAKGGIKKLAGKALRQAITPVPAMAPRRKVDREVANWNRLAGDAFRVWGEEPKYSCLQGRLDFRKRQRVAYRTVLACGEAFVCRHRRENTAGVPGLRIEINRPEALSTRMGMNADPRRRVRPGIEYDADLRPVRYWFESALVGDPVSFEAKDVIHLHRTDLAGQLMGEPALTPASEMFWHGGEYLTNEVRRADGEARIFGIVKSSDATGPLPAAREDDPDAKAGENGAPSKRDVAKIDRFQILRLLEGEEFTTLEQKRPGGQFDNFVRWTMRFCAVGLGLSYGELSGDFRESTFASERFAANTGVPVLAEDREMIRDLHAAGEYEWFVEQCLLDGVLPVIEGKSLREHCAANYRMPGDPYINPKDDAAATESDLRLRLKTFGQALGERGLDLEEQLRELKAEDELAASYGVDLRAGLQGQVAAAPSAADDANDQMIAVGSEK